MATHSSVLAWRTPGAGSLVGCRLWGRTESDTTEATQQQQQQVSYCLCHSPASFGGDGPKFTFMKTVGLQAGGDMIPAPLWVDG